MAELESRLQATSSTLKGEWGKEVQTLQQELDRSREGRRRDAVESDRKLSWLQKELSEAHTRAHEAEMRASEAGRVVNEATAELRQQLADSEMRIHTLRGELTTLSIESGEKENKLKAARDQLSACERVLKDKEADHAAALQELRRRQVQLERDAAQANTRATATEKQLAERVRAQELDQVAHRRQVSELQDQLRRLQTSGSFLSTQSHDGSQAVTSNDVVLNPALLTTASDGASSRGEVAGLDTSAGLIGLPPTSGAGTNLQQRLERELVRSQLELAELRKVKADYLAQKKQLTSLTKQHDMLLQMYGGQEEVIMELKQRLESISASKSTEAVRPIQ